MFAQNTTELRHFAGRILIGLLLALLASLMLGGQHPAYAADTVATGARIGGDETRTRFVADLSRPVGFTVYVVADPYRVFIDMPGVKFDLPPDIGTRTRGLISEFRYGEVEEGRSRIVIDTKGPVLIEKSFIVEPQAGQPSRIVVDLVQTSEQAFNDAIEAGKPTTDKTIAAASATQQAPAEEAAQPDTTAEAEPAEDAAQAGDVASIAPVPLPRPKPGTEASATETESGAARPARADGRRIIVIDPGHGGIDPGAIGLRKTREKDVVLAFGLALRDLLKKRSEYTVIMTRGDDRFLSLRDRLQIARENEADLFIAIHADTVRGPEARGATIYTLSEKASDAEAAALAHKENRADIIAGIDLGEENEAVTDILIDLVQRESKSHALFFAKKAVGEMQAVTRFTGKPLRSAGFVVLKAPDVPSVLVELGYLSSKHDEAQLTSPDWRKKVANAMARAIDKYFELQVAARAP